MIRVKIERPWRFLVFVSSLVVFLILVLLLAAWFFWWDGIVRTGGDFSIKEGDRGMDVWRGLADKGYTRTVWPWRYYGWQMNASSKLKPGDYQLEAGEGIKEVIGKFISGGDTNEMTITFPEGFTLAQVANRVAAAGIGPDKAFIQAATPAAFAGKFDWIDGIPKSRDLEGYLFPDTYRFFADDQPTDVIKRMLANFDQKFGAGLRDEAAAAGRTVDQVVIMASIVEREVMSDEDMTKVAGVLWKRFDDGAGLDADATIRYALNKCDNPLTAQDLATDSPYNTRKWRGLPPGPISNPGLRAIMATVRPEPSDYYYYLSTPDGRTIFSKTLEEHNANKARYLR